MENGRRGGGIVGPVILIGLGILFMLSNFGVLPWGTWEAIWRLWPVLLIAIGLEILFGRRSLLGSFLALALTLAVLAGALWVYMARTPFTGDVVTETISQPLNGAERAAVSLRFGVNRLYLTGGSEPDLLISGRLAGDERARAVQDFRMDGRTAHYSLRQETIPGPRFWGRNGDDLTSELRLNTSLPMELKVSSGVGTADIDLSTIQVTDLDMNIGFGRTQVTLPARGQVQARINGGVGETIVIIPQGVAAQIKVRSGIGSIDVIGGFDRRDDMYISPGYNSAPNRVDLRVNGGVGRIRVQSKGR